jgi:hypothetical protein
MNIKIISAFAVTALLTIYSYISNAKEGSLFREDKSLELILEADFVAIINLNLYRNVGMSRIIKIMFCRNT